MPRLGLEITMKPWLARYSQRSEFSNAEALRLGA
jgi:hypothetical protein